MNALSSQFVDRWFQSPAALRLGSALLHFLWQGAVLALIGWALLRLLRSARPQVRYAMWLSILCAMAVSPLVTFALIDMPAQGGKSQSTNRLESAPRQARNRERSSDAVARVVSVPSPDAVPANEEADSADRQSRATQVERPAPIGPPAEATAATPRAWSDFPSGLPGWLSSSRHWFVAAWSLGVALLSLRLAVGMIGAERTRRCGTAPASAALQEAAARLQARMSITRPIRVCESALAEVPTLVGWMRPVILLPIGALCGLSSMQVEALLAHELAHVRRHDWLVNLFQTAVETVLFYHPGVWWVSRQIRQEREHCCDDEAVALCGDPLAYARTLAVLEERRAAPRWVVAANTGTLAARIRRILGQPEPADRRQPAAVFVVALLLLSAGGLMNRSTPQASEPPAAITVAVPPESPTIEASAASPVDEASVTVPIDASAKGNAEAAQAPDDRAGIREIMALLDHNRPWLDAGPHGTGWQPSFKQLSYTFHTVREDVKESCVLDAGGEAVIEVAHDGQGKMQDRLGNRFVSLNSRENASTKRGAKFARINPRPERERGQPFDLALKQYARIGCQFDLPLFRYRGEIETAQVHLADGEWKGTPCRVATVSDLRSGVVFGCGTMLGHTSWSYIHHIRPTTEVLYVDPQRHVVLHETLANAQREGERKIEIDFLDYAEVAPGQWAPRAIRVESPGYFWCEYQFQIVAGTHWLLKEVTSWFDPEHKSRGVVEDVRVNGSRQILDEALQQVAASRLAFGGDATPGDPVRLSMVPFVLNEKIRVGPYELRVTPAGPWNVAIDVSTADRDVGARVPVCFFDDRQRLLFAPTVDLVGAGGQRTGSVKVRGSQIWKRAKFIALSGPVEGVTSGNEVRALPVRWNAPMAVNIPENDSGRVRSEFGETRPHQSKTSLTQLQLDRLDDGTVRARLDVVSVNGPQEFYLDLSLLLLGEQGELVASGHLEELLRVESHPVERQFEIDLRAMAPGTQPRFVVVGIAPGNVTRAPAGSLWAMLEQASPFDDESDKPQRRGSRDRESVPPAEKTNLQRTTPDAEGRFTLTFDNPLPKRETQRLTLDPGKHQVIFQVVVRDAGGKLQEKIFRQLPARAAGGYRADVQVKPEWIEHSQASITFVTIQPDHETWVKRFFHEGKGTSYSGMWSGDGGLLPTIRLDDSRTGWLPPEEQDEETPARGNPPPKQR